ncbi:glycosyltransferase [Rubrivirga sp.]|uniref:glycosyltransferase n=1 Tax=Rubrivirga sp. TaxID=1885344 RepID=UPI003C751ACD
MARIALVGPSWPYRGGIAHFQTGMQRALEGAGHDVSAVTFRRQYPELLFPGTTQFDPGPPPRGLEPAAQLLDSVNPLSWPAAARFVAERADVAVLSYWMPFLGPAIGTVARGLRKRGVTTLAVVHNAIPHERKPGDLALGRYALRDLDGAIALSESVEADLKTLGLEAPIHRIEHPVYSGFGDSVPKAKARTLLGLEADAPVFLFFGFIRRYKGLHVLLEAWANVRRRLPAAQLVIAGEFYADEAETRATVADLEGVRLEADYIPDSRVPLYFGAADVVVQPYVSATQSGVAQIAFHFGRPVITSDVGGLAEIIGDDAGLVVPPDDASALEDAMVRFVEDDLEAELSRGVERQRDRFSWDRLVDAVEGLAGVGQEG